MVNILELNFSHRFDGVVWNMVSGQEVDPLVVEVRNLAARQVTFSALDPLSGAFLWRDRALEAPWWINLTLVTRGIAVFTVYLDTNNPDKKRIMAYNVRDLTL